MRLSPNDPGRPKYGVVHSWKQLTAFLPSHSRVKVSAVGALSFLGGICESLVLLLLTLTADGLIRGTSDIEIGSWVVGQREAVLVALLLVSVRVVTILTAARVSSVFAADVMENAQFKAVSAYLQTSYAARSSRPPGDLNTLAVNYGRFTGDLASSFTLVSASLCGVLAFSGTSLVVNPLATLGIAVIGLLVLAAIEPLRRRSQRLTRAFVEASRVLGREVAEVESLQREIDVFHVGEQALGRVGSQAHIGAVLLQKVRFLGFGIPQLFQAAMLTAAVMSILLIVGRFDGEDLASVGAIVLLLIRSMSSAQQYVNAHQRVISATSYAEGINESVATLSASRPMFGDARPGAVTPLRLRGLGFSYDGTTDVLTDIDIEFGQGELVGVVGPSGAGKSTLVELLLRLRTPTTGGIFGGVDWQTIEPGEFASRVAFVPQQAVLIAGTVAENVDLFRGLSEERIKHAITSAHLESEVADLPHGVHTLLGPGDHSLSGGQRQRLTIARALAGDPDVLILDEPTSALDTVSEDAIRRTLEELTTGHLVIVVAHRFSTVRSCSRIVVLNNGRIEVDASPALVTQRSEYFRAMVKEGA